MLTILNEWTNEEVRSVIRFFMDKEVPLVEIHLELVALYGANVMTEHVRKWCRSLTVVE
jgi:uncharacterized protein YktA (UPF0223 family)